MFAYSNLVIANANGQCSSEGDELYTEPVAKHEVKNGEEYYMDLVKENQGKLYETAEAEAVLNPVYERFDFTCILHTYVIHSRLLYFTTATTLLAKKIRTILISDKRSVRR